MIYTGIGGWSYDPWRETFYPPEVPRSRELEYASRQVSAIEVNGTFYRTQTPQTFAKWRDATPEGFVFSLKAPRYATQRKVLAESGSSIERFLASGVTELKDKLGPILWQLEPRHAFEPDDLAAFFSLLPPERDGRPLRHVLEVRHRSFLSPAFIDLARSRQVATVYADTDEYPSFADVTADFAYARLMRSQSDVETGYPEAALDQWAHRARTWARGARPEDLPCIAPEKARDGVRDVFLFFISAAKERNPAAARALRSRLGQGTG